MDHSFFDTVAPTTISVNTENILEKNQDRTIQVLNTDTHCFKKMRYCEEMGRKIM